MTKAVAALKWLENAEHIIRQRRSTRGFNNATVGVTPEQQDALVAALNTGRNPFKAGHRFEILETDKHATETLKLGTYGVIKGAKHYLISAIISGDEHLEALGFDMEYAVLQAQAESLGTCWLGGTFNKGQFATAMGLKDNEFIPIVIPFGKPGEKDGMIGRLIRHVAGSNQRFAFEELFFKDVYANPLSMEDAGQFATALEMVRLGPSASNKQPWRAIKVGSTIHFYLKPTKGYSNALGYDIQRVDMGIAICHFDAVAQSQGLNGHFEKLDATLETTEIEKRDDLMYIISFIPQ